MVAGWHRTLDLAKADEWYRRAIARGSQSAILLYASLLTSRGDFAQAEAILRTEIEKGWPPALYRVALVRIMRTKSPRRYREALPYLEQAGEKGHPLSRILLGRLMAQGRFGLGKVPRGIVMVVKNATAELNELKRRNEEYKLSQDARLMHTGH
jgi:TPR repeat protein